MVQNFRLSTCRCYADRMSEQGTKERFGLLLALLWSLLVLYSYFSGHKTALLLPLALAPTLLRLFSLCVLLWLLAQSASPLIKKLGYELTGKTFLMGAGLGFALLCWFCHSLLFLGVKTPLLPYVLLFLVAVFGRWQESYTCDCTCKKEFATPSSKFVLVLLTILLIIVTLRSQTPPVGPDSLIYHIKEPAAVASGADYRATFAYPFWGYMHDYYTFALGAGGDIWAKSTGLLFTGLTLFGLYFLVKELLPQGEDGPWALLPALFYLSSPAVLFIAGTAYLEAALAFYCVLSCLIALQESFWENVGQQALFAFFLVFAVAIKQTALLFATPMGFLWFFIGLRKNKKNTLAIVLVALALFSFHPRAATTCWQQGTPLGAYKSVLTRLNLAGDSYRKPPFPQYEKLFNIKHMRYRPPIMEKVPKPLDIFALAWFVSTANEYPAEFLGNRPTPIYLLLLPLLLWAFLHFDWRKRSLLLLVGFSFLAWYLGGTYWLRFFTPLLAPLALVSALAIHKAPKAGQLLFSFLVFMAIFCLLGSELLLLLYTAPHKSALGLEAREEFLLRRLPHIAPMTAKLKEMEKAGQLGRYLVLGNGQDYYYPGRYIPEGNNLEVVLSLGKAFEANEDKFANHLRSLGVKHVLVDGFGLHFWLLEGKRFGAFPDMLIASQQAQVMIENLVSKGILTLVHKETYQKYQASLYRLN